MLSRQFLKPGPRHLGAAAARINRSPRQTATRFYSSSSSSGTSQTPSAWPARALVPLAAGATGLAIGLYSRSRREGGDQKKQSGSRDHDDSSIQSSTTTASKSTTSSSKTIPDLNKLGLSDKVTFSPPPTSEDVTRQLNEGAWSVVPESADLGISRYDGAQLGSNSPCEDAYIHGSFASPFASGRGPSQKQWVAWGVFDGHCGWQMSDLLTRELVPSVRRALGDVKPDDGGSVLSEESIEKALKAAFTTLDDAVVKTAAATIESDMPFPEKARRLEAAYAGACALLALFDPATRTLRVASTGDCRAVLGRRRQTSGGGSSSSSDDGGSGSKWETTELTADQTGANPDEVARIRAQFPDEPSIVAGGRVWGMQPSRTFGDGMWKWPAKLKQTLRHRFNGLSLPSAARYKDYKEGPYLTAEPAVAAAQIPDGGDAPGEPAAFLILATDGLWDAMTSAQAVDLVGRWLDRQRQRQQAGGKQAGGSEEGKGGEESKAAGSGGPTILGWKRSCRYEEAKATVRDDNAAVHLVRNGLGGADEETVRGALTFRYPNSRDIRDDITVQVVFFKPTAAAS